MTVQELKMELEGYEPESEVRFLMMDSGKIFEMTIDYLEIGESVDGYGLPIVFIVEGDALGETSDEVMKENYGIEV